MTTLTQALEAMFAYYVEQNGDPTGFCQDLAILLEHDEEAAALIARNTEENIELDAEDEEEERDREQPDRRAAHDHQVLLSNLTPWP